MFNILMILVILTTVADAKEPAIELRTGKKNHGF